MADKEITVALVGNLNPPHSTESEYFDAYERAGHKVMGVQEGDLPALAGLLGWLKSSEPPTFVQWTRTKSLADQWGDAAQWEMIAACHRANVPLIGVHLDAWFGLKRETQVLEDPYFKGVDMMLTADGGNQDRWDQAGITHRWLLPAISERWLGVGEEKPEYKTKLVFVGSWSPTGGYHREAQHRYDLVAWLDKTYGDDVLFLPRRGEHAIRGLELNNVYASAELAIGDSAILPGKTRYLSDRTPETTGRGGILLHPAIEGVNATDGDPFEPCTETWEQGNWGELRMLIGRLLSLSPETRMELRERNVCHIAASHTYTSRVHEIVDVLKTEGML